MIKKWVLTIVWISVVLPSSDGLENISGDYTGYGSLVRVRRKAADSNQLWPDGIVPYTFLEPQPSRGIIMSGLSHWETHTCIRFTPVNNTDFPHLQFRKLSGCRSGVGIEGTSGQNVSIGDNCNKLGIVVHEIGHALGFYHEIRRPDRDDHVVINEQNILKDELFNFYKLHWLDISIKYDLSSVMHYNPLEWSSNERTTVATKDPMLQGIIGRWKQETDMGLSHRDKLLANTIYGCLDRWLGKCNLNRNPCKNEGYLSETCTCICAPGTSGRTCETTKGGYYDALKSPCSQEVRYSTSITSPNYPLNYDTDTWCVYRLKGEECQAPEIEIVDFQLGPRSHRNQCFHDYLEIRDHALYNGFIKCGTDVARGTKWISSGSTMILYFKGSEGGYRGFKARVRFNPIPGCCRTHTNSSAYFLHTPGYPHPYAGNFNCSYSITAEAPARVVVTVTRKSGSKTDDRWTCALKLCQPHGRCHRHCKGVIADGFSRHLPKEVILPNVASVHYMQFSDDYSPFSSENAAFQVGFTLEDSPCHRVIIVNRTEPRGWITVGPRFFELLQCEWWLQAPRGSHVKIVLTDLHLPVHEDSYLAVNEAGEASYPRDTTRVYHDFDHTPKTFVSFEYKLAIVLQGDFITQVSLKYELYDCIDTDDECEYWAANDECEKNPYWMKQNCKKSCAVCEYSAVCEDEHNECEFWATHEQCNENRIWMNAHCKKSCGYCDLFRDANPQCPEWAEMGDCKLNPSYMNQFCRKSCGLCGNFETTTPAVKSTGNLNVTSTNRTPISTADKKNKEANRPNKHRTINQTYKPNKNKLKRYRNKSSKPIKDRFDQYEHNNVMLPPYGEEDKDVDSYKASQLVNGLSKDQNLKRPFDTGRASKPPAKKRKKAPFDMPKEQGTPKLHRSRTSSPNTRIGNYRSKKRKYKLITHSHENNLTEEKESGDWGDASKLVVLPLTQEKNESALLVEPSVSLNSSGNVLKIKYKPLREILVNISSDQRIKHKETDDVCQEDSSCFSPQIERPVLSSKQFDQAIRKFPKIINKISRGKSRKLDLTNVFSKKVRKQNKPAIKKRNRNKNRKTRCKKNRGRRKQSLLNNSGKIGTRRHSWQSSRRSSKPEDNQGGRNIRRKNEQTGKGRSKGHCRGSRKQSGRHHKRTHGRGHTKPDKTNDTTTWSTENIDTLGIVSTTVRGIEIDETATTSLPYIPQPSSSILLITREEPLEESFITTEFESELELATTTSPVENISITDPSHSSTIAPTERTSLSNTTAATLPTILEASNITTAMSDKLNSSKNSQDNMESNSIFSGASLNTTSSQRKRKGKHRRRLKKGHKNNKFKNQQKLKIPILDKSSRRSGKRNQKSKQNQGRRLKKTRHRNIHLKTNFTLNKNKQSRWHKRRKKHRLRKGRYDVPHPSYGERNKVDRYRSQEKDEHNLKHTQNESLPFDRKKYTPEESLTTASPPAPSSTSVSSPEEMMILKIPDTQTEVSTGLHKMVKTEPEARNQIRGLGTVSSLSKTEDDKIMNTKPQLEELGIDQNNGPPKRTPEKYADWGIGPVRSLHHTGRRARPRWKYRRSFYRRDHIYEDIWPLFDGTAYGKKR